MWEEANDNIAVLFKIVQSYHTIKLTCSNRFRLYFINKNNWGGGLMKRYLREVIGN